VGTARRILPSGTADHLDDVWRAAATAPSWSSTPVWCHGDLHPANVLVDHDRISAVIDFGDLTAGDPATDLSVAWSLVPAKARHLFWDAYADAGRQVDDALVLRARGWATTLALVLMTHSADAPLLDRIGHATLAAVLAD
jgi:aminoglycoside phosphotransferase (APT) family kinase protein